MIKKMNLVNLFTYLVVACVLIIGTPIMANEQLSEKDAVEANSSDDKTITGVVIDEFGDPLIGVSVVVKSTATGSATDLDGKYSVKAKEGDLLEFTYIGFVAKTVKVGSESVINMTLVEDTKVLDEVIVIGYGTTTRKSAVGAVDQVSSKLIENRPVGNVTQALQGTSANLVIQQKSMNPNDNSMNINLRGVNTIGDNSPLLVIDGIISQSLGNINDLNPNDIESVSILKDAGTAAIYGSRSSNGVILVTTKQGKRNMKPVVRFGATVGSQTAELLATPLKGYQNALLRNDAYVNSGENPLYSSAQIRQFAQGDSQYFMEGIIKDATQQNYNLSVQGGTDNTTYMVSLGYYDQESNFKGPNFGIKRYNFRNNFTVNFGRLKLTSNLAYVKSEGKSYQGDTGFLIADASRVPVYGHYVLKGEDGRYYNNDILTGGNPLMQLEQGGYTRTNNDRFTGNLNAELDIYGGLKARAVLGYELRPEHRNIRRYYHPVYNLEGGETPVNISNKNNNDIEDYSGRSTLFNPQVMLDYQRTFSELHTVNAMVGYSDESYKQERHEIKMKYVDPVLGIPTEETEIDPGSYNTVKGTVINTIKSVFGRVNYSFADKYYAEFTFRYDGSSRFASNNRWGFFPSGSLSWRMTEESFLDYWKQNVGEVKLRSSYGVLGNQNVSDYRYFTTYDMHQNQYSFNKESVPGTGYTFANPDLKWESTHTFDIGIDATFLNNSLTASFDYFHQTTKDILLTPKVPKILGGAVPEFNMGEVKNQGWELTLGYHLRHGDFSHNFGANLADSWNEVTKFEGFQQIDKADEIERIIRVGLPINSYYGYKTDGFFQNADDVKNSAVPVGFNAQPGDVKYVDRNGDGVIDDNDRFVLGSAFPRYSYGFNYDVSWKGFDMNMLWQGVGKRKMALRGEMVEPYHGGYSFVMYEHQLDYWTPHNTDARYPRLTRPGHASTVNNYGRGSDLQMYDASYLRLKDIQVGYTLPKQMTAKVGMNKVRVYFSGQNLLTLSKNSFIDPESSEFDNKMSTGSANSGRNYPFLKYFGGGIDIEF